jgi:SAM-dependent methyltransferase
VRCEHEPEPRANFELRRTIENPAHGLRWLIDKKLPHIISQDTSARLYVETSHIYCKGFVELFLDLGLKTRFIILRRSASAVARSLFQMACVPERTESGRMVLIGPSDPGVLKLADWESYSDYQLCYWYAREIERRQDYYAALFKRMEIPAHDLHMQDLLDWNKFAQLCKFVHAEDNIGEPDYDQFLLVTASNQNPRNVAQEGNVDAHLPDDMNLQEVEVDAALRYPSANPVITPTIRHSKMRTFPDNAPNVLPALTELLNEGISFREQDGVYFDNLWKPVGVTEQFIEDAGTYHERYFARLDFLDLTDRCLAVTAVNRNAALRVLDIGCGGGSSVFALCQMLPASHVIASDISPQLLRYLSEFAATREDLKHRITSCCFDLHVPFFKQNCFDLVFGAAILHSLVDPALALKNVAAALKPGGSMILVEPMEAGSLVMTILYERVLVALKAIGQDDGDMAKLMRAMRLDIQARLGVPVLKPFTAAIDDKWVFDEPYLQDLAREIGLSAVEIHTGQRDLEHIYETNFRSLLSDSGNAGLAIPPTVLETVQEFDNGISLDLKRKMCPTGIIVFTK